MAEKESIFERKLVEKLEAMYPGAYVIKNNPNYRQGFPDRIFLYDNFWAAFDTKREASASHQPNQAYYIKRLNQMSLAMFVYPENEQEFLDAIQRSQQLARRSRISGR